MAELDYTCTADGSIRFASSGDVYRRRPFGRGHPAVTLEREGAVLHAERLDLFDSRARRSFATQVGDRVPTDVVAQELLALTELWQASAQPDRQDRPAAAPEDEEAGAYRATPAGLIWLKPTMHGCIATPISNFTAQIICDTAEDDGSGDLRRSFTIRARLGGRQTEFELPAELFHLMAWPLERLGAQAILYPGLSSREHTRVAIQTLSGLVREQLVYAHTGWREVDGQWVYLHAGGAIGSIGSISALHVRLDTHLGAYVLPEPPLGAELVAAVRSCLGLLGVAPRRVTVPLLGMVFRAVLPGVDFSGHLVGPSGAGKSQLAALAQQCFGPAMTAEQLPANWTSTANANEMLAFAAKNALLVVDDFAPTGTTADIARLHRDADRLLRAQGNGTSRQRMRADTSLRPPRPPRGLILSTGEDTPRGQSLRARLLIIEVSRDDLDWDRLSACQADAGAGRYAAALAGYLRWLAADYPRFVTHLGTWEQEQRGRAAGAGSHKRTPTTIARLAAGWTLFLRFAVDCGAVELGAADALYASVWDALTENADAQAQHQQASEAVTRFLELLRGALAAGRAHVASVENQAPEDAEMWGWEYRPHGDDGYWVGKGDRIGWVDGEDLYLEPDAAFTVAQRAAISQGEALAVGQKTLHKRLQDRGLLRSTQADRLTVRVTIGGKRLYALHLAAATLLAPGGPDDGPTSPDGDVAAGSATAPDRREKSNQSSQLDQPGTRLEDGDPLGEIPAGSIGSIGSILAPATRTPRVTSPAEAEAAAPRPEWPDSAAPDGDQAIRLIRDGDGLRRAIPELLRADLIGLDTETTGLDPHRDRLRLVQLAVPGHVYLVDCFSVDPAQLAPLFVQGPRFAGHNLAFDLRFLLANGIPVPQGHRLFDTMLASQLLHAGLPEPAGTHTLAAVVERRLGETVDKTEQRSDWSGTLSDQQLRYAATDAAILLPLVARLEQDLAAADLDRAAKLEFRALPALAWLMHSGAPFDSARWQALADGAVAEQIALEAQLTAETGLVDLFGESTVNWASPVQVADLLRNRGHSVQTTDEATLQRLVPVEPLAALLLQYREASRRASTYGIAFLQHVHPVTGRLHADFRQLGAASGRMSCTRPNLQNLPRDPLYRGCVRPGPGRALVKADYSQIELRIAAQLSQDPTLLAAYRAGADVHVRTAAAVTGSAETEVTKEQRQLAKALNFGLLYGMGATTLQAYAANDYGVELSETEAQIFRERFFATYPSLRRWHRGQRDGVVETRTLVGRRRQDVSRFTEKLNTPVQGTGADILKLALARLWEDRSGQPSAVPVLCVHDEIVVECDATAAEAVAAWLKRHLEAAGTALLPDVPVIADVSISADWSGTPVRPEEDV